MTRSVPPPYRPVVVAHRGARDMAPDNTRPAFDAALSCGADGIELDVQTSADGVAVVYHDQTLYRIAGKRIRLYQLDLDALHRYDWGRWFGPQFEGQPVLTLEEVLDRYVRRSRLLVEVKSRPGEKTAGVVDMLVDAVIDLLSRPSMAPFHGQVDILSFDGDVLRRIHEALPGLRCVLNVSERRPQRLLTMDSRLLAMLWGVCIRVKNLDAELVSFVRRRRKRLLTYACNIPRQVHAAMDHRADVIMTDRPCWLVAYLKRKGVR